MTSRESGIGGRFAAIVGAPRCGTTSLARYLEVHPDVDFSFVKEPHFFSQYDLTGKNDEALIQTVEQEYLARYFPDADPDSRMLMEGSVTYLYTPHQIEAILRVWPEAKFIIAVRDPFALLPSLHQRLLFICDETEKDFARAWALAPERALGKHVPATCIAPEWLQYPEIGRLGSYVEKFFAAVGRERCLVVLFDDFVSDPAATYRQVLTFLGLPDDKRTDFSPQRSSLGYKIGWLQRLLKRPPTRVRVVMGGEKLRQRIKKIDSNGPEPWLVRLILRIRRRLLNWNEAAAPDLTLSPEMQAEIRRALSNDVAHLARLLGRDLSHWLGGVPKANMERPAEPPAEQEPAPVEA